jgi:hypothetical protein
MKWISTFFVFFLVSFFQLSYSQTQSSFPKIDKEKLKQILDTSTARLNIITIFTNDCGGTAYMFKTMQELKAKFPGKILLIPCSSERETKEGDLKELLQKYQCQDVCYLIDGEKYKEKKSDTRFKGYQFRNDICNDCIIDQIGVPYYLLVEPGRHILYAGYTAPGDFDRLMEYIMDSPLPVKSGQ